MSVIERERVETPQVEREVTEADVLHRAADLIEEFGWCQAVSARDVRGEGTSIVSPEAVSFCIGGAVLRAGLDLGLDLYRPKGWTDYRRGYADELLGYHWDWNDKRGRTKAEVVARLRSAAERSL
jgi:hypothetical protein